MLAALMAFLPLPLFSLTPILSHFTVTRRMTTEGRPTTNLAALVVVPSSLAYAQQGHFEGDIFATCQRRCLQLKRNHRPLLTSPFAFNAVGSLQQGQTFWQDMLSEALLCFGASSSSIEDADDSENLDVDDSANLDNVLITSIFTDGEVVNKCISLASSSIGMKEVPSFEVKKCEQRDWIKTFEETFHPVKITDSFWVIPQWTGPQDVHATNIILNPGLAFGTGEHPTTKLCLLLLNEMVAGGENVLDYGTGSGVLGISAIKLGAAYSLGVDVDPQAILSASQNAALNNIGPDKLQLYLTTCKVPPSSIDSMHERDKKRNPYIVNFIQPNVKYDIVVANIILNPLLELAEKITSYAKSGGTVGISGFLVEQLPQIEECYSSFLENMSTTEMDGWVCVRGTKK
ncbi:Ribosomal protein L11 methyltransferase [Nymphaea thermarum]|nr:Ribosomal protein L11 methyltransferase [Nymphaea thermarum]